MQLEIMNNGFGGLWIQNQADGQTVAVHNALVAGNQAVGVGLSASKGVTIDGATQIMNTAMHLSGVSLNGMDSATQAQVGDGVSWIKGAEAELSDVSLSGNARQSIIIDGPVGTGSGIDNPTLTNGDDGKGIVIQRVAATDTVPDITGTTTLTRAPTAIPVAIPPAFTAP
jgi:hypothetical protein